MHRAAYLAGVMIGLFLGMLGHLASAQQLTKIEYVSFETNVVPNTTAAHRYD